MTLDMRLTLSAEDIPAIVSAFAEAGQRKSAAFYRQYLTEQAAGERQILSLWRQQDFAGHVTILWNSHYAPFRMMAIPEINDLVLLPSYRGQGWGRGLVEAAEREIGGRADVAGIGVGLTPSYGVAQRMYVRMGYMPDGRGVAYRGQPLEYGQRIQLDDELVLYLVKYLPESQPL